MDKMILIVEDNPVTSLDLQLELESLPIGPIDVRIASNYAQALKIIEERIPECLIVDIDLCDEKDGIDLALEIRRRNLTMPLIYLTADNDLPTKERAAATMPTTYLPKPFIPEVLRSTIEMALLTYKPEGKTMLTDGVYYQCDTGTLYVEGEPIALTPQEKRLVVFFAKAPYRYATSETLTQYIWDGEPPVAPNALRTLIYRLHKKLPYKIFAYDPSHGYGVNAKTGV